jgi:ribonucleoside-diphosphate reductase alpha chain
LRFPCDFNLDELVGKNKSELKEDYVRYPYNSLVELGGGLYVKRIKAKEYWNEIIKSAHQSAEPGLMFWDSMVYNSPDGVYPQYKQVTTNPCSEIAMQPYDACRLIAVNLFSFVDEPFTKDAMFNLEKFYKINYEAMRLSDDLVELELGHITRI